MKKPRRHPKKERRITDRINEAERESLRGAFDGLLPPSADEAQARRAPEDAVPMTEVEWAAFEWWRSKRPIEFCEAQHIHNPAINTCTDRDEALARAVAKMVARQKAKRER